MARLVFCVAAVIAFYFGGNALMEGLKAGNQIPIAIGTLTLAYTVLRLRQ